jgi:hypothetical protein
MEEMCALVERKSATWQDKSTPALVASVWAIVRRLEDE